MWDNATLVSVPDQKPTPDEVWGRD